MVGTMKSQVFRTAARLSSALFFLFSGAASAATVTVHVGAMGMTGSQGKSDGYMDPVFIFYPAFVSINKVEIGIPPTTAHIP